MHQKEANFCQLMAGLNFVTNINNLCTLPLQYRSKFRGYIYRTYTTASGVKLYFTFLQATA